MLEGFNEELKEAEAMVKEISEEQVSLLMLKAMAGYPIFLKGRGRGIQLREGRDESVRGLVLSKAQIIKIKQYVSYGLKEKEFTVTEYAVIERNPKTENSYRILRVPKVVMQEVKRRQQLIELRKTDSGIEYKNFDYVCCQENGEPRSLTE